MPILSKFFPVVIIIVVSSIACLPLVDGLPRGHDWMYELVRMVEFNEALLAGQFPPAWAGDLYGGYGSPFFMFYAPFFYFISAIFFVFSSSYPVSMIYTLVGFTLFSTLAIYLLGKQVSKGGDGPNLGAARISIYLYVLNPYLLSNKLLRNSNAEFAGLCLLPLVLLGVFLVKESPRKGCLVTSIALALVTITHNITALSAVAFAVGLALLIYLPRPSKTTILALTFGIFLGLWMAVFFWLPAFSLLSNIRSEELLSGKFDFHKQYIELTGLFDYSRFYSPGVLPLGVMLFVVIALLFGRKDFYCARRLLAAGLGSAVFLLFMVTQKSMALWEVIPLLPYFEFPWRLLGPLSLIIAISGGLAYYSLTADRTPFIRGVFEIAILGICIANTMPGLRTIELIGVSQWDQIENLIRPSSIRRHGLKATVYSEFMPKPSERNAWRVRNPVKGSLLSIPTKVDVVVVRNDPIDIRLNITASFESELQLARWFFPGWNASLDGKTLELKPSDSGVFAFTVPVGSYLFRCYYDEPRVRKHTKWLSLIGLAIWLLVCCYPRQRFLPV